MTRKTNPINRIIRDKAVRRTVATRDHSWFFAIYFAEYIKYESAPFHHEMFAITEDEKLKLAIIVAFRGSGKSTIFTLSYPLWAILGKQQKKFVIITGQTEQKARQYLLNIKTQLESNELLRADLGPFQEERNQWGSQALVIPRFGAKIAIASTEQSIRGLRHNEHRPDLIIIDDAEDLNSTRTREGRNKTWEWLTGDMLPAGAKNTKVIAVGNLLHEDCLLKRLQAKVAEGSLPGVYREYPIVDEEGNPTWLGMYPTQADVERKRIETMDDVAWSREYLLKIISSSERVVRPEWLQYYDDLPERLYRNAYRYTATGIDLAISNRDSADFTAMVTGVVYGHEKKMCIYILPHPINERLGFPEAVVKAKLVADINRQRDRCELWIEDVGYQAALVQELKHQGYQAYGVPVHGQDKAARLRLTTSLIKEGRVLFPKGGCEQLIEQLIGFGRESHDDLADAFAILVLRAMEKNGSMSGAGVGQVHQI